MKSAFLLFTLLCLVLAAGCASPAAKPAATSLPMPAAAQPGDRMVEPSPLAPIPTPLPTAAPQPTATQPDPALEAASLYASALQEGNFEEAARMLSSYSLMVEEMTRTEAASRLQKRFSQEKLSGFRLMRAQQVGENTVLVSANYQVETLDAQTKTAYRSASQEVWALRFENHRWLVNYGNLIDFHTLEVPAQTTAGLTVKPRQLTRYTDGIRLRLLVQNRTSDPIVLGQANEIMAVFLFGGERIEAEKNQFIFDRLRSYPDVVFTVKGQFERYPDGIIIRQWKNYNVAPWFTFDFNQ